MLLPVVEKAAELVGGKAKLVVALACTRQALHQWRQVPRGRAIEIEHITGGAIPRHDMRPDLWLPETPADEGKRQ